MLRPARPARQDQRQGGAVPFLSEIGHFFHYYLSPFCRRVTSMPRGCWLYYDTHRGKMQALFGHFKNLALHIVPVILSAGEACAKNLGTEAGRAGSRLRDSSQGCCPPQNDTFLFGTGRRGRRPLQEKRETRRGRRHDAPPSANNNPSVALRQLPLHKGALGANRVRPSPPFSECALLPYHKEQKVRFGGGAGGRPPVPAAVSFLTAAGICQICEKRRLFFSKCEQKCAKM